MGIHPQLAVCFSARGSVEVRAAHGCPFVPGVCIRHLNWPLLRHSASLLITCEQNDVCFIPEGWWHEVACCFPIVNAWRCVTFLFSAELHCLTVSCNRWHLPPPLPLLITGSHLRSLGLYPTSVTRPKLKMLPRPTSRFYFPLNCAHPGLKKLSRECASRPRYGPP